MSGNQSSTPGRSSMPTRLSATPLPHSSSNPRLPLQQQGASGRPSVHAMLPSNPLPLNRQSASGHSNLTMVPATNQPRLSRAPIPDPNRRFTVTDPTVLARIMAHNRQAHLRPSVPFVQSPAPTPAPQFILSGQSSCRPPNPSYHYEQVTRAMTAPFHTVQRHPLPTCLTGSDGRRYTSAGSSSLDRLVGRMSSSQGSRVRDYSAMPSVSLLGDRSHQPTPSLALSLASRSNFAPTPPKPTSGFVDLSQNTVGGQVAAYSEQPNRGGVIDSTLFDRQLDNLPSMCAPKASDYSSTQRLTTIRNFWNNTEEVTYEQSRQHQPPPQHNQPTYQYAAGSSSMPARINVGGQYFTQQQIDEAVEAERLAAEQQQLLDAAAAVLLQHQQQQDVAEAQAILFSQTQEDERAHYERQDRERQQRAQDLADQEELRINQHEEEQIGVRLRRVSASSQRPTVVDQSSNLFDSFSLRSKPTLNQINSLEHSEAGSIADEMTHDLLQAGDSVDSSLPFDSNPDDDGALNLVDNREPIVYAFVKEDVEPTTVTTTATEATAPMEADQAGSSAGRQRGRGHARKAGVVEDLSRRFRHESDSDDGDVNEAPAARASDRKSTNKLAFNRDVYDRASAYSDGEEGLEENEESDEVPDGFMKIPKYNYIHPRTISACALTELIQSVTDEDLVAYRKVVRDNIVGQLVLLSRGDVPSIDRPAMNEDERTRFQHLLEDPSTYQLGEELPSAIIQPPIYRKLQYLEDVCDDGLSTISEEARECGAFIYALQGQAARRNVKGVARSKDINMEDYVQPDGSGLHLPRFFMLEPASSNAVETFTGKDVTEKYHALIANDPHKIRELLLAYHGVGRKVDKSDISYLFPKEENRPVKVLLMKNLARLIWSQYPNLKDFNKHFWAHIQRKHGSLVFVTYQFGMSLINADQEVVYFGQTNKRGYLGVAFGTESEVCMPQSSVRMFGVPEPFGQHPGKLVVHDYQESSRTVNYSVRAESADEVIDIERKHLFPAEYAKCPLFNLHPKFYNPQRLVELSEGRIKVGICVLNSGEMLTHFDGAFKGQIALGPLETSNTRFAAAYNRTLALQLSQPRRLGPVCTCYGHEENAIIAADTQPRLDAAFRSLTRDPAFQLTDESENACFPCRLYPVGDTWEYRQGVLQNHLKAGRDKESDLPRLACPSPMGNIPKELRDDLKSCHADRIARGLSVDVLATAAAGGYRKPRKPRTKKAPKEKQPADTDASVSGSKRPRKAGPLSFKPRSKRAKMDVDAKDETPEDREDETPEETPKNRKEENEDAESEEHEESEPGESESGDEEKVEKEATRKRPKKSPIVYSEDEDDDDKPVSPDCQEVEEQVEEKSSNRKGKKDPPPSVVEPATASAASKSSKKAPKTNKPSTKEKATVEPEKMSTRLSAAAAKTAAIPATPKRGRRELDRLLKSAEGFGASKPAKRTVGEMKALLQEETESAEQEETESAATSGKRFDPTLTYDIEAGNKMALERGVASWALLPPLEIPLIKLPVCPPAATPLPTFDMIDTEAGNKLAHERGLLCWTFLPKADMPRKAVVAADETTPGTSRRGSASKRTLIPKVGTTPSAIDNLRSKTKAASEAAKKADKEKAAKKKGGGMEFKSREFVDDDDDTEDEKANGDA